MRQMKQRFPVRVTAVLVASMLAASGCRTASPNLSVSLLESPSTPPPNLTDRVRAIHENQLLAYENLKAVHEEFKQLTTPQAVDITGHSRDLKRRAKVCRRDAEELGKEIESFQQETEALITDWKRQLASLGDAERRDSRKALEETEEQAERVLDAMRTVRKKLQPVLASLDDYILFFDHNLNARAIAALDDTYESFDEDMDELSEVLVHAQNRISTVLTELDPASRPTRLTTIVPDDAPPEPEPVEPEPPVDDEPPADVAPGSGQAGSGDAPTGGDPSPDPAGPGNNLPA